MPSPSAFNDFAAALQADDAHLDQLLYRLNRTMVIEAIADQAIHDLRNSVQVITMAAGTLAEGVSDERMVIQLGKVIVDAADKMRQPMECFLTAPPGIGDVDPEPIALQETVHSAVQLLQGPKESHGVAIDVDLPPSLPPVHAVEQHIRHALLNLFLNAREALEPVGDATVQVSAENRGELVHLIVADNGPGIDNEIAARMFEPFFTTKTFKCHFGLGLSVAARLVSDLRGSLAHERVGDGSGACFVIRLPVA
jgi:two-component system, NtrC family, sensor histidine kinase HydH